MRTPAIVRHAGVAVALSVAIGLFHPRASAQATPPIQTVFVIVFENHNWSEIAGSAAAPYINTLLTRASYALQYYTPAGVHPSTPNYWWMEAGQDFGLAGLSNYTTALYHQATTNHLVTQLRNAGISWKTYHEDIDGTSCPLVDINKYTVHHNPFVFFDDVTNTLDPNSAYCIAHVRPFPELATDLAQNTVARYNFIIPNLCNDMHDCSITSGDNWLAASLPVILNSPAYLNGGAVFITWDEGTGASSDGPLGMIVMSPAAKGNGYTNSIAYTHSSLLLTLQEIFNVRPLLGDAPNATDLSDLFASFPAVVPSTPTPADQSTGVNTNITLKWSSSGGADEVRFGAASPPPSVATAVATRSYTPATLAPNTTYYWQVVSHAAAGTTAGPVWSFTTGTSTPPPAWTNTDIGNVVITGSVTYAGSSFTVKGAGADIWGTADAFQYVYQPLTGDGQIVARVTSLQNTSTYAKAGVMIRNSLSAGSDHVILDVKPGGGVEFMQRATAGGSTRYLAGATMTFPVWLRLTRSGTSVASAVSRDGVSWTPLGTVTTAMSGTVLIGLPVCSHTTSSLTTAIFDNVAATSGTTAGTPPPGAPGSPSPADGATAVATTPTLTWSATGATTYDVNFGTATPPPAAATGLSTASYAPGTLTAGTKYYWQVVAHSSGGTTAGAVWSFTTASSTPPPSTGALPAPWQNRDVGSVGLAGSASYAPDVFTVKGAGADIWGSVDAFQFVYRSLSGDGQIVARVTGETNTNTYAKAGVMMRQTLAAGSAHVILDVKPGGGIEFMTRSTDGGTTKFIAGATATFPAWLQLTRTGDTFTAYTSTNGVTWVKVGSTNVTMTAGITTGIAVCSHNMSALNTATFDNVQ